MQLAGRMFNGKPGLIPICRSLHSGSATVPDVTEA